MVTLGDRSVVMPSAVYSGRDGSVVVGEVAERRAVNDPQRVARQFKRRLGDPIPVRLGERAFPASELLAIVLRDVLDRVTRMEGVPPERVVLTHPANWGPFRRGVFAEVPRLADLPDPTTVTEPEAAALHYAAAQRLATGATIAAYDLGGGTFDATVVRKQPDGPCLLGTPEGVKRLGGVDFDQAVFDYVRHTAGTVLDDLNPHDSTTRVALARLRLDCILAKEALSADRDVVLPVFLPGHQFEVRLTREGFDELIRARIESTITALTRALRSAEVTPEELDAVLLVGGSSRIPLVASMVSEGLGRPVVVDTIPNTRSPSARPPSPNSSTNRAPTPLRTAPRPPWPLPPHHQRPPPSHLPLSHPPPRRPRSPRARSTVPP
jgi:molecular chaperone DnaK (HSP70)